MLVIKCQDHYDAVIKFAESVGAREKLEKTLKEMQERSDGGENTVTLYFDRAPYSFGFDKQYPSGNILVGGIIYRGPTSSGGSFPTLSVSVSDRKGHYWDVNT